MDSRPPAPEAAILHATYAVLKGKAERIAEPGVWRVFREGALVCIEQLKPANDTAPTPEPSPIIA